MTTTAQSQELFTPEVVEFFKTEAEKIAKTGLAPALALDAIGAFGNYGSLDSLLTPVAAVGGMAGYYGGRNHLMDGPVLAGAAYGVCKLGALVLDYLKDGRVNEAQPDAVKYLAAYALAALAGKTVQYTKDNWKTKTKPAIYATGRAINKADKAFRSKIRNMVPSVGFLFKRKPATDSADTSSPAP